MTTDQIITLVAQLGFPIFVAVYLLVRMEGVLKNLNDAISTLCAKIDSEKKVNL